MVPAKTPLFDVIRIVLNLSCAARNVCSFGCQFLNRLDSLGNRLDSIEDERGREEMRIDQIDKELAEVCSSSEKIIIVVNTALLMTYVGIEGHRSMERGQRRNPGIPGRRRRQRGARGGGLQGQGHADRRSQRSGKDILFATQTAPTMHCSCQ